MMNNEVRNVMKDFGQDRPLILVIDGEQKETETIGELLREAGFGCQGCSTPEEAIAASAANPPDLVICDWNLHGEDGIETCRRIREQTGASDLPIMFLSGAQRPDVIRRSQIVEHGAYCLRKPFAPKVLLELIDQVLAAQATPTT
jgi:DNA-binding response OmpR family regulator